jgi:uncharacterized protein
MHTNSPSKTWRLQNYRYRLLGSYCSECKKYYYPFRMICSNCKSEANITEYVFNPKGKVVSWSQIHAAPVGFEKYVPYIIALIKLDEGPVVLSQICDCDIQKIKVGIKVEGILRRLILPDEKNIIKYGIKFRPANW